MGIKTIDTQYQQLQSQTQSTVAEVRNLAGKLQGAAQAGNQEVREWLLDLKSVALSIQAEQNQVALLLQAPDGFIANQTPPAPIAGRPLGPTAAPVGAGDGYARSWAAAAGRHGGELSELGFWPRHHARRRIRDRGRPDQQDLLTTSRGHCPVLFRNGPRRACRTDRGRSVHDEMPRGRWEQG